MKKAKVRVAFNRVLADGTVYDGYYSDVPGLAIYRDDKNKALRWTVLHIQSGLWISQHRLRAEAAEAARRIGELGDWTQEPWCLRDVAPFALSVLTDYHRESILPRHSGE